MTPYTRPFQDRDYAAVARIRGTCWPDYASSGDDLRYGDTHTGKQIRWGRLMCTVGGVDVGTAYWGNVTEMYDPRRFELDVFVLPRWQGRGIGRLLFEHVVGDLRHLDPELMRCWVRDNPGDRALRFLLKRGFVEDMRERESQLDIASFDFSRYDGLEDRLASEGIVLKTLPEIQQDEGWEQRLYEAICEMVADVPSPESYTKPGFQDFHDNQMNNPHLNPDTYVVAVEGGEYVGHSGLWKPANVDFLSTGLTGVRRNWRRRSIATAMKVKTIRWCADHGIRRIITGNEENNPMFDINMSLGFKRTPDWVLLVKHFDAGESRRS